MLRRHFVILCVLVVPIKPCFRQQPEEVFVVRSRDLKMLEFGVSQLCSRISGVGFIHFQKRATKMYVMAL